VEHVAGTKVWNYKHELHREDGPAVITVYGEKMWFLNGEKYTETDWNKHPLIRKKKLEALGI